MNYCTHPSASRHAPLPRSPQFILSSSSCLSHAPSHAPPSTSKLHVLHSTFPRSTSRVLSSDVPFSAFHVPLSTFRVPPFFGQDPAVAIAFDENGEVAPVPIDDPLMDDLFPLAEACLADLGADVTLLRYARERCHVFCKKKAYTEIPGYVWAATG